MKRLIALFQEVLEESGTFCGVCTDQDLKTVLARYQNEGLSFLTITLPTFSADLEKGLSMGYIGSSMFPSFTRKQGLPVFLSGFTSLIFDTCTGVLLDEPCVAAVRAVRQVCSLFKHIGLPCSDARQRKAFTRYIQCEHDVRASDQIYIGSKNQSEFKAASEIVFRSLFLGIERKLYLEEVTPKHSAGSTADGFMGNRKYYQSDWPVRLQRVIPWDRALLPTPGYACESYPVNIIEPGAEIPVKVITVPKTQKTPRIIGMEPTCMQYVQQGLLAIICDEGQMDKNYQSFCQNWDQTPNQRAARIGSIDGSLATLDMSDASDRVSYQHVRDLIDNHPLFLEWVDACRSRKADVSGFGVQRLAKFASMGSALCFPFEAMVFTIVVLMGCARALNTSVSPALLNRMRDRVRVYGDDIIVPAELAIEVSQTLQDFGFVVNVNKSFWTGLFRESCGKDYFKGFDVSYIKVKSTIPSSLKDVTELVSTVSLHNKLFSAGYFKSAEFLRKALAKFHLAEVYPGVNSVLGLYSYEPKANSRFDRNLHKLMIRAHVVDALPPVNPVSEHQALMKFFVERGSYEPIPQNALLRSGRSRSARIKAGWYEPRQNPEVGEDPTRRSAKVCEESNSRVVNSIISIPRIIPESPNGEYWITYDGDK